MKLRKLMWGSALICLSVFSAHAAYFGAVLPDTPVVEDPDRQDLKITLGRIDPFAARGAALERPQAFTALRRSADTLERSEHLSVLDEVEASGAPAWSARIALPEAGVYHFLMESKPVWMPEQDSFVQYFSRVQVPVRGSDEGWDKPLGDHFEIVPLTRPFGLCSGMSFRALVLLHGKPLPGATIEAARLREPLKRDLVRVPPSGHHTVQVLKTDEHGLFDFTCPQPGWWVFAALSQGDPLQDPNGLLKPLQIRAEFWVYLDPCKEKTAKQKEKSLHQ